MSTLEQGLARGVGEVWGDTADRLAMKVMAAGTSELQRQDELPFRGPRAKERSGGTEPRE